MSLTAAAYLASLSMIGSFALTIASGRMTTVAGGPRSVHRVSPDESVTLTCLAGAALVWIIALAFLWKPKWIRGVTEAEPGALRRGIKVGVTVSVLLIIASVIGLYQIDRLPLVGGDRRFLSGAALLLGAAILGCIWLTTIHRLELRTVIGAVGRTTLFCPTCGYDLRGRSELTCPECGRQYTIDQLMSSQPFVG